MNKYVGLMALSIILSPSISFADLTTMTRESRDGDITVQTQSASESPFSTTYTNVRETTTMKTFKPAPSDTDYTSNNVNPGTVETETSVREYTTIR